MFVVIANLLDVREEDGEERREETEGKEFGNQ